MNSKDIRNIILLMLILIVLIIINLFKYNSNSINRDIKDQNWYRFNNSTGYYDKLYLSNNTITFSKNNNNFNNCNKYKFDKMKMTINLDCDKKIKIYKNDDKTIILESDGIDSVYFKNINDSLNYEFESYYEKSIVDYKNSKIQVTDFAKINENKLIEVLKRDEFSKIVFMGDKCTSLNCILALDIMEKWVSMTENIYFYDSNSISDNLNKYLSNIDDDLINSEEYLNDIYPKVIISKNNKIVDKYSIICSGFNCQKYYVNEF